MRYTFKTLIETFVKIHGDEFDYSHITEYKGLKHKYTIYCKKHNHNCSMSAGHHIYSKTKCKFCSKPGLLLNTSIFKEEAKKINGTEHYDYTNSVYVDSHTLISIKCNIHPNHKIEQSYNTHIFAKQGCGKCAGNVPLDKEEWVEASRKSLGDNTYGYISSIFPLAEDGKVDIWCFKCNEMFRQNALLHRKGSGHTKCCNKKPDEERILDADKCLLECKEYHKDSLYNEKYKYDYSLVDKTKNIYTYQQIICLVPGHGEFTQTLSTHRNHGCQSCARKLVGLKNRSYLNIVLDECNEEHDYKYIYTLITDENYKGVTYKYSIICPFHDKPFKQSLDAHRGGQGCPVCGGCAVPTNEEFIERSKLIFGQDRYDYSKTIYEATGSKLIIICHEKDKNNIEHGEFEVRPNAHLSKRNGCDKCGKLSAADKLRWDLEELKEECRRVHNGKYIYDLITKHTTIHDLQSMFCPETGHGRFYQTFNSHRRGHGCSICSTKKNEKMLIEYLKEILNVDINTSFRVKLPTGKRAKRPDIHIKEANLIIEYNGIQHYEETTFGSMDKADAKKNLEKQMNRDRELREYCVKQKINLLEIDGRDYHGDKMKDETLRYFTENHPELLK